MFIYTFHPEISSFFQQVSSFFSYFCVICTSLWSLCVKSQISLQCICCEGICTVLVVCLLDGDVKVGLVLFSKNELMMPASGISSIPPHLTFTHSYIKNLHPIILDNTSFCNVPAKLAQ